MQDAGGEQRTLMAALPLPQALLVAGMVILASVLAVTVWVAWRLGVRVGEAVGALLRTPPGR